MPQVLEGQEEACEEFRAGLILLNLDLPEFSNLTGIRMDNCQNYYRGKSKPPDVTLAFLRLMVSFNIDPKVAWAINRPNGLDLVEVARSRLHPEKFDRTVPIAARGEG